MKRLVWSLVASLTVTSGAVRAQITLTFDAPQTAGISGLRPMWDAPIVLSENGATKEIDRGQFGKAISAHWLPENRDGKNGAIVFDAVHRSLLVRFPGAANKPVHLRMSTFLLRCFRVEKYF